MSDIDTRGGVFFLVEGVRTHESDLTPAQRSTLGLPELPAPTVEPTVNPDHS